LQELLAPASVKFFDQDGLWLDDKANLAQQVCDITGIAEKALSGTPRTPLMDFWVSERYEWARTRQTSREEDWAYSLQGVFGVFISPQYGEGKTNAVRRLVKEVKEALLDSQIPQAITIGTG